MRILFTAIFITMLISCKAAPKLNDYKLNSFAGNWVMANGQWPMANGQYRGQAYKAIIEGKILVLSPLGDTDCLRENEKAYFGEFIGNQILGKAYICTDKGNRSTREITISMEAQGDLIVKNKDVSNVSFPNIRFERDIYITQ